MQYVCLVYEDPARFAALSPREADALDNEALDSDDALRRSGHFVAANALEPPRAATSVRVRDGKVSMTDGPFAETKEQLGGFILIEAKDLDDALKVAAKIPMARLGTIEVRPVRHFDRKKLG